MTDDPCQAKRNIAQWHGTMLIDRNGEKFDKLQDVCVDVETDVPQFGTVKEGIASDVEMHGVELSQGGESALYQHFELNYTPSDSESGRRLARRCGRQTPSASGRPISG